MRSLPDTTRVPSGTIRGMIGDSCVRSDGGSSRLGQEQTDEEVSMLAAANDALKSDVISFPPARARRSPEKEEGS